MLMKFGAFYCFFNLNFFKILINHSDQMGNKGAYIHLRGSDLKPEFHQFTAVVSVLPHCF